MKLFDAPLGKIASFTEADRRLSAGNGPVQLTGCVESQKVHMMSRAGNADTRLVVTYDDREARTLSEDLKLFSKNVLFFPAKDLLFYQADIRSGNIATERMKVIRALYEGRKDLTIVTTMTGMMNTLAPFEQFAEQLIGLSEGAVAEIDALAIRLIELGYERTAKVETPGEFAIHGGILDIYDLTEENPYRIEFWDTEIDTIRFFNAETQLSLERVEEITIYPATELFLTKKQLLDGREKLEADYRKNLEKFKKKDCSKAEFLTIDEGLCVQIMHTGSFDNEPETVEIMNRYIAENGYESDFSDTRLHHEIYLSDARKVAPEKLKTVIRHPIKQKY